MTYYTHAEKFFINIRKIEMKKITLGLLLLCSTIAINTTYLSIQAMEENQQNPDECHWDKLPTEIKSEILLRLQSNTETIKEFFEYNLANHEWRSLINKCPLSVIKTYDFPENCKISINDIFLKAASLGHYDVVEILIARGIDINVKDIDKQGLTLSQLAAKLTDEGAKKCMEKLANQQMLKNHGDTALTLAVTGGHLRIVELLIDNGANLEACDSSGDTALLLASRLGNLEIAELLILHKANVDAQNQLHFSSVALATRNGHRQIVQLLIDNGANINCTRRFQSSALETAVKSGQTEIAELLKNHISKNNI
jgi:ankyrin repeat protein